MEDAINRGMGAGMQPELGATHDFAFGTGGRDFPPEWDYARGIASKHPKPNLPVHEEPVVPTPPSPGKEVVKHAKRSGIAIAGSYAFMIALALFTSSMSGHFGFLSPSILAMLVAVGPILACAYKDYMHWMDTGDWDITEPTDEPSV